MGSIGEKIAIFLARRIIQDTCNADKCKRPAHKDARKEVTLEDCIAMYEVYGERMYC